ncbi:MAG: peptide ABC transporter substrate-binding protein [Dehalococcoidia bacterium]|nr:peptide ABC transporter substrate-binding protein [Dehalococcoidia bacterium]
MKRVRTGLYIAIVVMLSASSLLSACQLGSSASGPQEFRANLPGEPPSLDPNLSTWSPGNAIIEQLSVGLLRLEPDASGNMVPKAAIAKEIPTIANGGISKDGKIYTFKLRSGMKYSDGQPVRAQDIEYSVKRLLDPDLAAMYASFYFDIVGAKEYNTAKGTKSNPKTPSQAEMKQIRDAVGVKAKDDLTVEFTLTQQRWTFLQLAAMWPIFPVRQDIVERYGDKWTEAGNFVGNGPFKMTEWVHKDHITLVPNENYYGTKPQLQKVTWFMVTDTNANYAAYLAGERDYTDVPQANIDLVRGDPAFKDQIVQYARLATSAAQFNLKKAPFDNLKVRQAFSTAIDRETYVQKVRRGVGQVAYSWIPPGMPGHQADLGSEYKVDAAKAKSFLANAGYPDGKGLPAVSLSYADQGDNKLYAEFIQANLKDNLGVQIKLEPMDPKSFADAVNAGNWQMSFFGWSADYPDPDNWLPELFGTGAGNNLSKYSSKEFDDIVAKAKLEPDDSKRLQLWNQAQKKIVDDAVVIFLNYNVRFGLLKPYVKVVTTGMDRVAAGDRLMDKIYLTAH